ncbi:MAG: ribulokinase [Phycisphaeraceae bacterium]|nr:ribulokinase [Phycisphaeraceae bacterium]
MATTSRVALGLDFGTESVRALLVDLAGRELGSAVATYPQGQITRQLPTSGRRLPEDFALQDPEDWITASVRACREAVGKANIDPANVMSIGVDFTSCTMLPCLGDGTPLCLRPEWREEMYAWPKLWKHHGAKRATEVINRVARQRKEKWLKRYGGIIGLEWFFPKILETLQEAPRVYAATEVWIEAGDWYVWQLVGAKENPVPPRSTCQAGYKAMWNAKTGYPSAEFFAACDRRMRHVVAEKMPGRLLAPGTLAGGLCGEMAEKMGLAAGIPVSAAVIDAHAGVPGAGVSGADTLVMVMGTSSCHMLNSRVEKLIPGVAGVVEGGILPGFYGYETGQAAVGDAFEWLRRVCGQKFEVLSKEAEQIAPGSSGVTCVDWMNGCRTPLMDGSLRGGFMGLSLGHEAAHLYRALLEASAFGVRWIVELLREGGVPVKKVMATGGLPHHNPLLVQIYADVLGVPVTVHPSRQGPALGAAILGVLAAGTESGFRGAKEAVAAMASAGAGALPGALPGARVVRPVKGNRKAYDAAYARYRSAGEAVRGLGGK